MDLPYDPAILNLVVTQRLQFDIQQKHCSIYCSTHITVTIWNQLRQPVIVEQLKYVIYFNIHVKWKGFFQSQESNYGICRKMDTTGDNHIK